MIKAKYIKKLRKKVSQFKTYKMRECFGLFGFDYDYATKKDCPYHTDSIIKGLNPEHAILRYFRYYNRKYKIRHKNYAEWMNETTYKWGRFMIEDEKGYRTFWG